MYSQRIKLDILNHAGGDLYARTGEGERRAVLFSVTSGGDNGFNTVYVNINNPVIMARIVKPDGTFTITTAELISGAEEIQEFRFYIPEAATQVSGMGSYDIRIQEDGEENIVYSAQGRYICDDNMLTDEMIESVAEVNGLIFPDDFATTDNMEEIVEEVARELGFAEIDDNSTSTGKTWSSDKIADEITDGVSGLIDDNSTTTGTTWSSDKIADEIADGVSDVIDDNSTSTGTTWSSDKIADEIADGVSDVIDDNSTTTGTTWSSDKIADEIASAGGGVDYSETEHEIGTWIDGSVVYEKTISCGALPFNTDKTVSHGIASFRNIISITGYSYNPLSGISLPIPYVNPSNINQVGVYADATYIHVFSASDLSQYTETALTIRYLKTV